MNNAFKENISVINKNEISVEFLVFSAFSEEIFVVAEAE